MNELKREIKILNNYEENWDLEGAKSFSNQIFVKIREFIANFYSKLNDFPKILDILPKPFLLPNNDGTIDVVWQNEVLFIIINFNDQEGFQIEGKAQNHNNLSLRNSDILPIEYGTDKVRDWLMKM